MFLSSSTSPIGLKSSPKTHVIDSHAIRQFGEAIPVWDGFEGTRPTDSLPWTFPVSLAANPIEGLSLPESGLIHGEQRFRYGRVLEAGMEVTVTSEVVSYKERGDTAFITLLTQGKATDGALVFESESLLLAKVP